MHNTTRNDAFNRPIKYINTITTARKEFCYLFSTIILFIQSRKYLMEKGQLFTLIHNNKAEMFLFDSFLR